METKILVNKIEQLNKLIFNFEEEIKTLKAENQVLKIENNQHKELIRHLNELISLNNIKEFIGKGEKPDIPHLNIFNEAEQTLEKSKKEDLKEYTIHEIDEKVKKKRKRKLPREEEIYKFDEKEVCEVCGGSLHETGEKTRENIVIIPAKVFIRKTRVKVYSCKNCEKTAYEVPEIIPDHPEALIEKSLASPEAVAHIINEKYVKGVPLYRLSANLDYEGIPLSRQTMSNWLIKCTVYFLVCIYNLLKKEIVKREILHADETVVQVLNEPNKKPTSNSYIWNYRTSGDTDKPITIFEYKENRSHENPKLFLEEFNGYLHADGYEGYHKLKNEITVVGCWIHARRKFVEALKVIPKEFRSGSNSEKGFLLINSLFKLEKEFRNLNPQERYIKRSLQSLPIVEELFVWSKSFEIEKMPKSLLRSALTYLLNQETYLRNVFLDGRLELSNNRAERTIKPFVIGRKNWLFCVSQEGASVSAILYSLVETAKENNLSPYQYIKFLLENVPKAKTSELENYLPWSQIVKDNCQVD